MDAYLLRVAAADADDILSSADAARQAIANRSKAPDHLLNLEESWAAMHYMLSGEVPFPKPEALRRGVSWDDDSLENVLMGGEPVPYKGSFGPARYLNPQTVAAMSERLTIRGIEGFLEAYNPEAMTSHNIPPGDWDDAAETRDWLGAHFEKLAAFYKAAATAGDGVLIYMI